MGCFSASPWLHYCIFITISAQSFELCKGKGPETFLPRKMHQHRAYLLYLECTISQRLLQRRPTGQRPSAPWLLRTWSLPGGQSSCPNVHGQSCQGRASIILGQKHEREIRIKGENKAAHTVLGGLSRGDGPCLPFLVAPFLHKHGAPTTEGVNDTGGCSRSRPFHSLRLWMLLLRCSPNLWPQS